MTDTRQQRTSPKGPWSNWPLQRIFQAITGLVLIFFTIVLMLSARQYLLYNQCRQAVAAGDRLLFQFTTIKDHLNESLVQTAEINLRSLSDELQLFDKEVSHLAADILVPEGLKPLLPTRGNLIGLEVQLRSIQEHPPEKARETVAVAVVRSLSGINVGLEQFRFGLGDHTQRILLGLHKIIVGALGLIVVLSCTLLYLLNYSLAAPILALCRLPGLEDGERCSLNTVNNRIEQLEQFSSMALITATPEETTTDDLHQRAHRFRCSVLGVVGAELASELTSRLNGILNYTQTLIDVEGQQEGPKLRGDILPLLVHEEKKAAELVSIIQKVGHWQPARPSSISLQHLFHQLTQLLEKTLQAESITLELPKENRYEALVPAGDLWLVLLTLINQARRALNQDDGSLQQTTKLINLTVEGPDLNQRICIQLNNSAGTWLEDSGALWPDRAFCMQLLQLNKAELNEQSKNARLLLELHLPCRRSVV